MQHPSSIFDLITLRVTLYSCISQNLSLSLQLVPTLRKWDSLNFSLQSAHRIELSAKAYIGGPARRGLNASLLTGDEQVEEELPSSIEYCAN